MQTTATIPFGSCWIFLFIFSLHGSKHVAQKRGTHPSKRHLAFGLQIGEQDKNAVPLFQIALKRLGKEKSAPFTILVTDKII